MNYSSAVLLTSQSMAADFSSAGILLLKNNKLSIQAQFTGSPVGTFKIQISNALTFTASELVAGDWTDLSDSPYSISAAGDYVWNMTLESKWARLVYTRSSGSGTCTAIYFFREIYI